MKRMGLVIVLAVFAVIGGAGTSSALSNDPKMFISADNTFYAYVKGGEKIDASFTRVNSNLELFDTVRGDITVTLDGPDFTQQTCILKKDVPIGQGCVFATVTASSTGIWRIQFTTPADAKPYPQVSKSVRWGKNWFNWNISVNGSDGEKHGRIWTERYAIRQPAPVEFSTDITNYYISEDGYIYRAVTKGYNGQISTLSADGIGIRKGTDCTSVYQSTDVGDGDYSPALGECGNAYKLFFEEPAGDLPAKAQNWEKKEEWIRPNINRPTIAELRFSHDGSQDQLSGTISFYLRNFIGQYQIKIDTDNNGSFDGQNDVVLNQQMKKLSTGIQRVKFQGVDRSGQIILPSQTIGVKVDITKVAEIHLVAADVEGRSGGLELVRLNGDNAPTNRMCWNDTEIAELGAGFTTEELDGRSCQLSNGGLHKWAYGDGSWGNGRYIDDWVYASAKLVGDNQIVYPDAVLEEAVVMQRNWILVGGIVTSIVVMLGVVSFVIIRRKKKAKAIQPQSVQPGVYPQQQVTTQNTINPSDPTNSGRPSSDIDRY